MVVDVTWSKSSMSFPPKQTDQNPPALGVVADTDAMRRFRTRFIRWCTFVGVGLCLVILPVDWYLRGSNEAVLWTLYFLVCIGGNGLLYWLLGNDRLWAAVIAAIPVVHLVFVHPDQLMVGYVWVYVAPVPVLLVAGLYWGTILNACAFTGVLAVLFLRPWPAEGLHLRWDIAASAFAIHALAVLYEYIRDRHAQRLRWVMATDALTGVYNRRHFEDVFAAEIRRAKRYERPLSLLLFDIDEFKQINDVCGHPIGDRVLNELGELVEDSIRTSDLLARIGGDEFAVLAPETSLESEGEHGSKTLAERLRTLVADHDFDVEAPVRLSVGVTQHHPDDTPESFYKRADEALYQAKQAGRDTVAVIE